jgi:predicted short-subunit dehydrogenase-like oxidoreductase (DUF2520 family)
MQHHISEKIVIAGAGRIARQLGKRLRAKGIPIAQVVSRTPENAEALAALLQCKWTSDWSEIIEDADWIIMAVRDDAIDEVGAALAPYVSDALVTHTSGATPGTVLAPYFERYGVFYPLQTFSHERTPVWSKIPFCVDASKAEDLLILRKIAKVIGNLVYQVNDTQRAVLHVAAVFANNFANHCFTIAPADGRDHCQSPARLSGAYADRPRRTRRHRYPATAFAVVGQPA